MTLDDAKKCVNISGIYLFRNKINEKCYVGQALKIRKRFLQHMSKYRGNSSYPLYQALHKYGLENFEFEILETFERLNSEELKDILNKREIYWIEYYESYKTGYNQTLGGEATYGWIPSEETRKKLSESLKGHPGNPDQMKPCKFINIHTLAWLEFESRSAAAKYFNIAESSIALRIALKYQSPINGCYLTEEQYENYKKEGIDISKMTGTDGKFEFKYTKEEFIEILNSVSSTVQITKKNIPQLFGICDTTFYNYLHEWNIPNPKKPHRKYKYLIVEDIKTNKYYKYTLTKFGEVFNLKKESVPKTAYRYEDGSLYKKQYKIYSIFEYPYGYTYPDQDGKLHHFENTKTHHTITSVRSSLLSLFNILDDITNWIKID